jgi:plastocyanin
MRGPLVALAIVVVSFAACGGGSETAESPPAADEAESAPQSEESSPVEETEEKDSEGSSSSAGSGEKVTAKVVDTAFEPNELTVKVGAEVTWEQVGDQPHSVTAVNEEFDSSPKCSPLKSENCDFEGDTYSFTFEEAGTYEYYCRIHGLPTGRGMFATLTVED